MWADICLEVAIHLKFWTVNVKEDGLVGAGRIIEIGHLDLSCR